MSLSLSLAQHICQQVLNGRGGGCLHSNGRRSSLAKVDFVPLSQSVSQSLSPDPLWPLESETVLLAPMIVARDHRWPLLHLALRSKYFGPYPLRDCRNDLKTEAIVVYVDIIRIILMGILSNASNEHPSNLHTGFSISRAFCCAREDGGTRK